MWVTVWRQGLATRHTASLCSLATAFHLGTSLLVVVAPLLLAYRSRGFWVRTAEYREQAEVHWRHEVLLLAELGEGGQLGWSTEPALATLLGEAARLPVIRSREEDTNRDGLLDQLSIQLTLPLRPGEEVVAVNTLLVFDVKLHQYSSVQLTGLLHLTGSGFPGSGVHTVRNLRFWKLDTAKTGHFPNLKIKFKTTLKMYFLKIGENKVAKILILTTLKCKKCIFLVLVP